MSTGTTFIVGLGGTARPTSSTERALLVALRIAEEHGATTRLFGGAELARLPHYLSDGCAVDPSARALVDALRRTDGLIIASPGYHGNISGLVKNALDYTEEMRCDQRPYLDGLPVGLMATAHGWQAACNTLASLRSITHALRGWPTPIGVPINTALTSFDDGGCSDETIRVQLQAMVRQIVSFVPARPVPALAVP